jgi:tRNA (guanine10-N2)-dimethyltransferase
VTRHFILASGEHIELAKAELDALTDVFNLTLDWTGRIGEVESKTSPIEFLLGRAALAKEGGVILVDSNHIDEVIESLSATTIRTHLSKSQSFAVRTLCVDSKYDISSRKQLETSLGAFIVKETGARVDLSNPDVTILVILKPERILVCRSASSQLRKDLRLREPGRKPFFHPSMMNSTLARVMCNLSHIMPGDIVLDPFCGGGGILCEAALLGARVVGSDVNWRLLNGAITNLDEITNDYALVQADTKNLPFSLCDALVTDPPYGRASSTRGSQSSKLVQAVLARIPDVLSRSGTHTCICGSSSMNLPQMVLDAGFSIQNHISIRVHSGLVRDIVTIFT